MQFLVLLFVHAKAQRDVSNAITRMRSASPQSEEALIQLLTNNNLNVALAAKNRRRTSPHYHIECEEPRPDTDIGDSECNVRRFNVLTQAMADFSEASSLDASVKNTLAQLLSQANNQQSLADSTKGNMTAPNGTIPASLAITKGLLNLEHGFVASSDSLWSNLIDVNNMTSTDLRTIGNSASKTVVELVNSTQLMLNREASAHSWIINEVLSNANDRLKAVATYLNSKQPQLESELVNFKTSADELENSLTSQQLAVTHAQDANGNALDGFEDQLDGLIRKQQNAIDLDLSQKVAKANASLAEQVKSLQAVLNGRVAVLATKGEAGLNSSAASYFDSVKVVNASLADSLSTLSGSLIQANELIASIGASRVAAETVDAAGRQIEIDTAYKAIKEALDDFASLSTRRRNAAQRLSGDLTDGLSRFQANANSSGSSTNQDLSELLSSGSGGSAQQLLALFNTLAAADSTVSGAHSSAKTAARLAMQKLAAELGLSSQSTATVIDDTGNAISSETDQGSLKVRKAVAMVSSSATTTSAASLGEAMALAKLLSSSSDNLSQKRLKLNSEFSESIGDSSAEWEKRMTGAKSQMASLADSLISGNLHSEAQLTSNFQRVSSATSEVMKSLGSSNTASAQLTTKAKADAMRRRLALADLFEKIGDTSMNTANDLKAAADSSSSALTEKLGLAANAGATNRAQVEHALQLTLEKELAQQGLLGLKGQALQELLGITLGGNRIDLAAIAAAVAAHVQANEGSSTRMSEGNFSPSLSAAQGLVDGSLGQVGAAIAERQTLTHDSMRKANIEVISKIETAASTAGKHLLTDFADAMGELSTVGHTVDSAVDTSSLAIQAYQDQLRAQGAFALNLIKEQLSNTSTGAAAFEVIRNLSSLNVTFLGSLANLTSDFNHTLSSLPGAALALAAQLVSGIFSPVIHLALNGSSQAMQKIASDISSVLAAVAVSLNTENAAFQSGIRYAISKSVAASTDLANNQLDPLTSAVHTADASLRESASATYQAAQAILKRASAAVGASNGTVRAALSDWGAELSSANQSVAFNLTIASAQASRSLSYADSVESGSLSTMGDLQTLWTGAAHAAQENATLAKMTVVAAQAASKERLGAVMAELANMGTQVQAAVESDTSGLNINLALTRRLLGELINLWTNFATADLAKFEVMKSRSEEYFGTLDEHIRLAQSNLSRQLHESLETTANAINYVDSQFVAEAAFERNLNATLQSLNESVNKDTASVGREFQGITSQINTWDNEDSMDDTAFENAVKSLVGNFERKLVGRVAATAAVTEN